jgi:hypothetical protein
MMTEVERQWQYEKWEFCPKIIPEIIPESCGHIESENCWCEPIVERYEEGDLVIHRDIREEGH